MISESYSLNNCNALFSTSDQVFRLKFGHSFSAFLEKGLSLISASTASPFLVSTRLLDTARNDLKMLSHQ